MQQFDSDQGLQRETKEKHSRELRPNLSNPQCKPELRALVEREKHRIGSFLNVCKD